MRSLVNLLLLDLDGTVRRCLSNPSDFINSPLDQQIIPEAAAALARWAAPDLKIIGCSNQAGVAAGYKTLGDAIDEQVETMRLAPQIEAIFFCPDSDGARCFCVQPDGSVQTVATSAFRDLGIRSFRKPARGMLTLAMFRYGASKQTTGMVGDRDEDRLAAIDAGVHFMPETVWWKTDPTPVAAAA